jgi:hypothetical protein
MHGGNSRSHVSKFLIMKGTASLDWSMIFDSQTCKIDLNGKSFLCLDDKYVCEFLTVIALP